MATRVLPGNLSSPRLAACALVELTLVAMALPIAVRFRLALEPAGTVEGMMVVKTITATFVLGLCLYYGDLYEDFALRRRTLLFLWIVQAFAVGFVLLSVLYYLVSDLQVSRAVFVIYVPLALLSVLVWRFSYLWLMRNSLLVDNLLILGTGQSAQQIALEMTRRGPIGFRVVGFLGEQQAEVGRQLVGPAVIGTIAEIESLVQAHQVNLIVVALDDRRGKLPLSQLVRCRLAGVRVEEGTDFFERITGKILVKNLRPSWLVFSPGFNKPRLLRNAKRAAEFVLALAGLLAISPLLVLLAVLIKLESRGPVFYRQERVGENGRHFFVLKLRSMRKDAESQTGPVWATDGPDPRVTSMGRMLRKLRLDELPQLYNVLKGEMSFVGPRPERPAFVEKLGRVIPYYGERHSVKPGITGWAQIKFGYGSTIEDAEEKLQYDLFYIKHMSFAFDIGIILDTIKVMAFGRGR